MSLKLNDPVIVENKSYTQPLQGVVAFLGPVSFSDGDDWVGVRLTGDSLGCGKNDGSVKGVVYFENCPLNGGVFVKRANLRKRKLTRLEELRLKRELTGKGTGSKRRSLSSPATGQDEEASVVSAISSTTNRSRLDEIRQRRLALTSGGSGSSLIKSPMQKKSPVPPRPSATPITENEKMWEKIEILTKKNRSREEENISLQKSLQVAEQLAHDANIAKEEAQSALTLAKLETQEAIKSTETKTSISSLEEELLETKEELFNIRASNKRFEKENDSLTDCLAESQSQIGALQEEVEREKDGRAGDMEALEASLVKSQASLIALEKELASKTEQAAQRDEKNASQYKERAKVEAEVSAWQRRAKEIEIEKLNLETSFEELTLDKDQMQEKFESMQDNFEELKIDAESAQIELDEIMIELEDARARAEKAEAALAVGAAGASASSEGSGNSTGIGADAEDVAQALSIQNSRLREAIVRLREQTSLEKFDLFKKLRVAEKEMEVATSITTEVETLRKKEKKLQLETRELKEMVDQGTAFEKMVEDLSDRLMSIEDNNVSLQITIRDLEEGTELNAEMEEAQNFEIKALMEDLQNRETIILNLEEAMKMQRRREVDFQRTVGKYKTQNEKLHEEKNALLALQQGGEGMKNHVVAASQKALTQAAQLVSAAAKARKQQAEASFHLVNAQINRYLSDRLDSFLPKAVASSEISSVKGELSLAKVSMKASLSLTGVADIFENIIQNATNMIESTVIERKTMEIIPVSDMLSQEFENIIHQTKFSQLTIKVSSECLKILAMGQWPDLVTNNMSVDLGNTIIHSIAPLDAAISEPLFILNEEGTLSQHRFNLNILAEAHKTFYVALSSATNVDGEVILLPDWNPPSLTAFEDFSSAKFFCYGAGSLLASIIKDVAYKDSNLISTSASSQIGKGDVIADVLIKIDQMNTDIMKASEQLTGLNVMDSKVVDDFGKASSEWKKLSEELFSLIEGLCSNKEIMVSEIAACESICEASNSCVAKLASLLRLSKVVQEEGMQMHPLSPETVDPWGGIIKIVQKVRITDGDSEDLNYILRARSIEEEISTAVSQIPKLSVAEASIISLKKTLATRLKEVSMQNSRLSELEKVLSTQTSIVPSPRPVPTSSTSSEEAHSLKEEIRVLTEAMEVLDTTVNEYEREIRLLKEQQKPKAVGKRGMQSTPRKTLSLGTDFSLAKLGLGSPQKPQQASATELLSLEASLFRPALRSARSDASMWKSKAVKDDLLKLPQLRISPQNANNFEVLNSRKKLILANAEVRRVKATVTILDLSKIKNKNLDSQTVSIFEAQSKLQILNEKLKASSAMNRLEEASNNARQVLRQIPIINNGAKMLRLNNTCNHGVKNKKIGRITFPGEESIKVIPYVIAQKSEIIKLHSILLQ